MKYTIISGSHRKSSQSEKVSRWLEHQLIGRGDEVNLVNLAGNPFPLWDESMWDDKSKLYKNIKPVLKRIEETDALIVVSPEWSGTVPGGLKNFFLYLGQKEVGHKPALLVSISSGRGGTYPIAELRMSSYKNTKISYMPEHLIVRNVNDVMNDNELKSGEKEDKYIKQRALFTLDVLSVYALAFVDIRADEKIWNDKYEYGM